MSPKLMSSIPASCDREEIKIENTEDESDLASISHERALLCNLHESDFTRLRFIEQAMKAIDRGQYGDVSAAAKTSMANVSNLPWARMCIRCQQETEVEYTSSRPAHAGIVAEVPEF